VVQSGPLAARVQYTSSIRQARSVLEQARQRGVTGKTPQEQRDESGWGPAAGCRARQAEAEVGDASRG